MTIAKAPKCIVEIQKLYNRYNVQFDAKFVYSKVFDNFISYLSREGIGFQDIDVDIQEYEFLYYVYYDLLESAIYTDLSISEELISTLIRLTGDICRDIINKLKTTGMIYVHTLNTSIIVYKGRI